MGVVNKDEKLNVLRDLSKEVWGDLSTEALVGILSTLITEQQLDTPKVALYQVHQNPYPEIPEQKSLILPYEGMPC